MQLSSRLFVGYDKRGKATLGNKTSEYHKSFVKKHIESFPIVDSHYTRKDSNRKYLTEDLSIRRMYLLYVEKCKEQNRSCVSEAVYRNVFVQSTTCPFFTQRKINVKSAIIRWKIN